MGVRFIPVLLAAFEGRISYIKQLTNINHYN